MKVPYIVYVFSIPSLQTLHSHLNIHRNTSSLPLYNILCSHPPIPSTPSYLPPTPSPPTHKPTLFYSYPLTSLLHASLTISLEREVSQFRAWMNLKLSFHFPALFKIIFDSEAMSAYERLFTTIMKVRIQALDVLLKRS